MRRNAERAGAGMLRNVRIGQPQRHAGALRGDGGEVQAQRAGNIQRHAAQQRLALAGVIGQRQRAGGRGSIEMEPVQPLIAGGDAGAQAQIGIRHEGHAAVTAAVGERQVRRGNRRQERRSAGAVTSAVIGEARGDVDIRARVQRQVRRQQRTGGEGGRAGEAERAARQLCRHDGLHGAARQSGRGQFIGGDRARGAEGLQAGRWRSGKHRRRRANRGKPRGQDRSVLEITHHQPLLGAPLLVARKYQTGRSGPRKTRGFLRLSCHRRHLQCRNVAPPPHGRFTAKTRAFSCPWWNLGQIWELFRPSPPFS